MKRTKLEQETVILFNEAEKTGTVWTASPRVKRHLQRAFGPPWSLGPESWQWDAIPKRAIRLPRPVRPVSAKVREHAKTLYQKARLLAPAHTESVPSAPNPLRLKDSPVRADKQPRSPEE